MKLRFALREAGSSRRELLLFMVLLFLSTSMVSVHGRTELFPNPPDVPPTAQAVRITEPPMIDGIVLGEPAWDSAPPITGFWQTTPDEGHPATEKTLVRIVFDSRNLYIGVVCYDRDPSGIIISETRRDSSLVNTDSFLIILDTYRDFQNGFVFGTNPAGLEYDGQVTKEGKGGGSSMQRQQTTSGGGFNLNWDGSWVVRTTISDFGWSAEFAIPFRTLRYQPGDEQFWGLNLQRNIRRHNETSFWAPLSRQFNLYRLSSAGSLSGLEIKDQHNLQLIPYVLGEVRNLDPEQKTNWIGDAGFDVKYSVRPSLTLDGTVNTDFAQVEVDEFQVNLDRFNLFFPEKRPFFLENAGFFSVGDPGEIELFFSRRIGIGPDGEVIPILAGGRLSGKVGHRTNVGLLNMQTQEFEGAAPSNNFTVIRVNQEFRNRSTLGGIFVNRQGVGEFSAEEDFNRTYGFDGRLGIGQFCDISGFAAATSSPDSQQDQYAIKFGGNYDSPAWTLSSNYTQVADGFNPEVGFLRRSDNGYRKLDWMVLNRIRPEDFFGLLEVRPHVTYRGYWNLEGFQETGWLHVDNHLEWRSGAEVHTGINFTREGLIEPFEIAEGIFVPPGTYDHKEAQLAANTDEGSWVSFEARSNVGGFFGGNRLSVTPSMRIRILEALTTEMSWGYNDVSLPGGDFTTNLVRARISYSFTPRVFVQSLIQYNDRDDVWSVNLRFNWIHSANTGLFIVYNQVRGFAGSGFTRDRSLTVKFNRIFNLLD